VGMAPSTGRPSALGVGPPGADGEVYAGTTRTTVKVMRARLVVMSKINAKIPHRGRFRRTSPGTIVG
jgi:hypothetical protein